MFRSLKSRMITASLLWTAGLLFLFHLASQMLIQTFPAVSRAHMPHAIAAGAALLLGGLIAGRTSLSPFQPLRQRLMAIRKGEATQVDGEYPTEVQPLIDELNALLEARQKAVARALSTAADLAHGLKTPLALLAGEAERAAAEGQSDLAAGIAHQVERMSRQVDYHLARARATASGSAGTAVCPVGLCAESLIRAMSKIYVERALRFSLQVTPPGLQAKLQREDLDEILGNLLENACKWTASQVSVSAEMAAERLAVIVEDDGPGLAAPLRQKVLERGVRLDEAAPGSGLGLAIVRDLVELYGGTIALDQSPLGGLRAKVLLPLVER
jgi:signal transduction histidine kinase